MPYGYIIHGTGQQRRLVRILGVTKTGRLRVQLLRVDGSGGGRAGEWARPMAVRDELVEHCPAPEALETMRRIREARP